MEFVTAAFNLVLVAFGSDPEILAALSGILLIGLVVCLPVAARLASSRSEGPVTAPDVKPIAGQASRS